jgi:hypothetical protein
MLLKVYAVRDAKAEFYSQPFYKRTHGEAERDFSVLVNDQKSTVHPFPQDYDLFWLGDYEDKTGIMSPPETPLHIAKAIDLVQKETH